MARSAPSGARLSDPRPFPAHPVNRPLSNAPHSTLRTRAPLLKRIDPADVRRFPLDLTMNIYTDPSLLALAGMPEALSNLSLGYTGPVDYLG